MTTRSGGGDGDDLFGPLFSTDDMLAATSGRAWVGAMLAFERELAAAGAEAGLLPAGTAEAVAAAADELAVEPATLGREARGPGNPVAPLVRRLREAAGPAAARWVHFGATSQDVLDTAAMLVARRAGDLVAADLDRCADRAAALADEHRSTVLAGRTLLQQALPTSFGLKCAGWLAGLDEAAATLDRVLAERLAVQLGGAVGSTASLGTAGPAVAAGLARRLGLAEPVLPWHTDRVRLGELAGALAAVAGACGKVAGDLVLLAQTEVGEVGSGSGGSSTMPHKRNPTEAVLVAADARRAAGLAAELLRCLPQEHERAVGAWHAEWPTLCELLRAAGGCAAGLATALASLTVDPQRMRRNLDLSRGVMMAERVLADLAADLGWEQAADLVRSATRRALEEDAAFADALGGLSPVAAVRTPAQLEALCDPTTYLGAADEWVDRAVAAHRERLATRAPR